LPKTSTKRQTPARTSKVNPSSHLLVQVENLRPF
jgi:hypothetical protein